MNIVCAPCDTCGQAILREQRHVVPGHRWFCSSHCRDVRKSMDSGGRIFLESRRCLCCGEVFLADPCHIGTAKRAGGADVCPACWRERLEEPEQDGWHLDLLSTLFASLGKLLASRARSIWAPASPCPRCGDIPRAPYEWSCRYPLAVGLCEGLDGPHVHSVCYRCGYEVVRLKQKKPPAGEPTRGLVTGAGR